LSVAVAIRIYCWGGIGTEDDLDYSYKAWQILTRSGRWIFSDNNGTRVLSYLPIALSYRLFGINELSLPLVGFLQWFGQCVVLYLLGRMLFTRRVAGIAVLLLAFYPLDARYASRAMPDVPVSFWTSLSVLLFLAGTRRRGEPGDENGRTWIAICFLSGVAIAAGVAVRNSAFMVCFFYVAWFAYESLSPFGRGVWCRAKRRISAYLVVAAGLFVGLIVLCGAFYATTGNFFHLFTETERHFSQPHGPFNTASLFYLERIFLLGPESRTGGGLGCVFYAFGLYFWILAAATLFAIQSRSRESALVVLWLWVILIYSSVGSMTFTHYTPVHKVPRHLTIVTVPLMLTVAAFLVELGRRGLPFKIVSGSLGLGLVLSGLSGVGAIHRYDAQIKAETRRLFSLTEATNYERVFADHTTVSFLRFYDRYRDIDRYKYLERAAGTCLTPRDAMLLNSGPEWDGDFVRRMLPANVPGIRDKGTPAYRGGKADSCGAWWAGEAEVWQVRDGETMCFSAARASAEDFL
jgi:4-amino-4-deoxy-L-arabinose transferase-like glycosyltransferase